MLLVYVLVQFMYWEGILNEFCKLIRIFIIFYNFFSQSPWIIIFKHIL